MTEQPSYWGILPANVRYDHRLSPMARILYVEFTALTQKNGICHASNGYFARLYQVEPTTVSGWVSELSKAGHIKVAFGKGNVRKVRLARAPLREKPKTSSGKAEEGSSGKAEGEYYKTEQDKKNTNLPSPSAPAAVKAKSLFTKMKEITEERAGKWASGAKEGVSLSRLIAWAENNHNGNGERFLRDFLDGAWALHRGEVRGLRERDVDYWKAQPYTPSRLLSNAAAICAVLEHAADKQTVPVELRDIVGRPV